jgi:chromosomal replication initiation ATPase DnaA
VFESWFSKLTLVQLSDGVMILRPLSKFAARWLTDHYLDQALRAWRELEPRVVSVRFDHTAIAVPEISSCTDVGSGEASQ